MVVRQTTDAFIGANLEYKGRYLYMAPRNYKKENANYKSTPEQIAKRVARKKARRMATKSGLVKKGDGKDVDHKNGNRIRQ